MRWTRWWKRMRSAFSDPSAANGAEETREHGEHKQGSIADMQKSARPQPEMLEERILWGQPQATRIGSAEPNHNRQCNDRRGGAP